MMNFKISVRHLLRNKLFSFLNILGLSFGIASFLAIYIFVQNELSFDMYHQRAERIFRLTERASFNPEVEQGGLNAALIAKAGPEIPEVEAFTRIESWAKMVSIPSKKDSAYGFNNLSVDPGYFDIFDVTLVEGMIPDFTEDPNTALISKKMADRFFPKGALGKTVKVREIALVIKGVYQDIPKNASLKGDFIFPFETVNAWRKSSFTSMNSSYFDQSYVLLSDASAADKVIKQLNEIYKANGPEWIEGEEISLQALSDVHFSIKTEDSIGQKTDKAYTLIFTGVGFVILICSFLNYLSMSVSQTLRRHKEIGLRKVLGANKWKVYGQFLTESFVLISMALIIGIVMLEGLIPQLEELISRELDVSVLKSPGLWAQIIGLIFLLTLLTAIYPAWKIAKPNATKLLKNTTAEKQGWLSGLSTLQVIIFMVLISVAVVSERQLRFMQNDNLGFDKDNQLFLPANQHKFMEYGNVLRSEFMNMANVEEVSMARSLPTHLFGSTRFKGYDVSLYKFPIGENYFQTLGMNVVAGRDFLPTDQGTGRILLNQTAVDQLNLEGDPVGQSLKIQDNPLTIVGVVSDFHFMSKKEPIKPIMFTQLEENEGSMIIKLTGNDMINTIAALEETYEEVTGETLKYSFLDEKIEAQYSQEKIMITMIKAGTLMAAIVAFIGLFGISGYAAHRRLKEMGIRKVLGASFLSIQQSLNRPGLIRLIIAASIAVPVIYYWMNEWLNSFAYRIEFPLLLVIGTLVLAGFITIMTTVFHSVKTYFINPVDVLKDE